MGGVVGFFFEISEEDNPAFESLFGDADRMDRYEQPLADGEDLNELDFIDDFSLADLIPIDYPTAGYYAYEGSLTTPPCTNIVRWHVMNARQTIGVNQMAKFREMMQDTSNKTMAPNYREIMPTFNEVFACGDWDTEEAEVVDDEKDGLSGGWIATIVAVIFALIFLGCFIFKSFKVQALQQELIDIAQVNRHRNMSEKQCDNDDAVNGVQSKGTMEMGDMQKV